MIHQVSGGTRGTVADMRIAVKESERYMDLLMKILAKATDKDADQVTKDCDRDYFMSSDEAKDYGIVDKVLRPGER
jgi:ATP-dependent Clp protease protease subunit